mmetsp:Transcript_32677/g.58690  ORF Transcript_32677/g.58690 Transcript_32677/m.58690 type:complete len:86 (+) Transcript_32677:251-508(+)
MTGADMKEKAAPGRVEDLPPVAARVEGKEINDQEGPSVTTKMKGEEIKDQELPPVTARVEGEEIKDQMAGQTLIVKLRKICWRVA